MYATPDQMYLKLIPYSEVLDKITKELAHYKMGTEKVSTSEALDRICAISITSEKDIPSCDVSAMDGYAIHSSETINASLSSPSEFACKANSDVVLRRKTQF